MWHPDEYLDRLVESLERKREREREAEPWSERRERLRRRLCDALGSFADPDGKEPELDPLVLERSEDGGLIRERVLYTTADGLRVPAYVLIPAEGTSRGKLPAVLAWHGHGYGSREAVGLLPDGSAIAGDPGIHGRFAVELAKRGMVALVPEIIGFGDRKLRRDMEQNPDAPNSCFPIGAILLLAGKTLAGLRVYEALRAADYLASRDDVDASRIGCMGFSGGGMVASLSAALDERIKATVICGYTNTYRSSIVARRHCLDNYIPGILNEAEMPELLGLIAPRALFVESGLSDHLFPAAQVREAIRQLQHIYGLMGATERLGWDLFEGKHEISGRVSYDWLARMLRA